MKKLKYLAMPLALALATTAFTACGGGGKTSETDTGTGSNPTEEYVSNYVAPTFPELQYDEGVVNKLSYLERSAAIYEYVFQDFSDNLAASKQTKNIAERYALMAIAEAKLLETGVMLPLYSNGGNYALGAMAPRTASTALFGNDEYRYHNVVVADKLISSELRTELKGDWKNAESASAYEALAVSKLQAKGYTVENELNLGYANDPQTWDALATSQAEDSKAIVNLYDGLVEYDNKNVAQSALAINEEVSEDGLTYTYTIREGVVWVNNDGVKVADLTADDFVAGFQHMLDCADDGLAWLVDGVVAGVTEYVEGETTDFSQVGVKADGNKVSYTLTDETPYFPTMLTYGLFAPLCRSYFLSQGGAFGLTEFDNAKNGDSYTYGKDENHIVSCGPYIVTSHTAENTIVFEKNPLYWNKENVRINKITWLYNDGTDTTKSYNDVIAGTIDSAILNESTLTTAKNPATLYEGKNVFSEYAFVSDTDATTFVGWQNISRVAFANYNDANAVVSTKTAEQKEKTAAAMLNNHFRLAISYSVDRKAYNAVSVGEELALLSLRNSYTPGNYVILPSDVTVKINGQNRTFKEGTNYGEILQAQLDADGCSIKAWDATLQGGAGSGDGFDGWYNVENARKELAMAVADLQHIGVEVSKANPVYLDLPCVKSNATYLAMAQVYKQSIEEATDGLIIVNIVECVNTKERSAATYSFGIGYNANFDLSPYSGWGPDYGDPQTYLDTFLGDGMGYMTRNVGIF